MLTQSEIIGAMQFTVMTESNPINTASDSRYTITYQFEGSTPQDEQLSGFTGAQDLSATEMNLLRDGLALIEGFLNVDFVEVSGQPDPDLALGKVQLDSYGTNTTGLGGPSLAYTPGTPHTITDWDGFAVYDVDHALNMYTALHEIGHALGLEHPFESDLLAGTQYENAHFSIMSYNSDPYSSAFNNSFQLFDVLALQDIWGGADQPGDTTYTGPGSFDLKVVWDTGGTDAFSARGYTHDVVLDLGEGHFSSWNTAEDMVVAFNVEIENAIGGAKRDLLYGNALDNNLKGNAGHDKIYGRNGDDKLFGQKGVDVLKGGNGDDRLDGGTGNDKLLGQKGADSFIFADGNGRDRVQDFDASQGDRLVFHNLGWKSEVLTHASELHGDVVFDFGGGDALIVRDATIDEVSDHIFVY